MGQSKQEFIDVRMDSEYYYSLDNEQREHMDVRRVHIEGYQQEYEASEQWQEQKKKTSYKEYKKLKDIEYDIRNAKRSD